MADPAHIQTVVDQIWGAIEGVDPTVLVLLHEKLEDRVTDSLELEHLTVVPKADRISDAIELECPHCFENLMAGDVEMIDTRTRECSTRFEIDSDGEKTIWANTDTYGSDIDVALRCKKCGLSVAPPDDWEMEWE